VTRASLLAAAVLAAAPAITAGAGTASADVIHVGGSARVRVGGGIRVRTPRVHWRPYHRYYGPRRVYVGGTVWVGGGYYDYRWASPPPPPPPPPCNCEGGYYTPAPPAPAVVVATPPAPRLARLGIGAFVGGSEADGSREGDDVGLLGRIRLTRGLILEGELAWSELRDDRGIEHRGGAALLYEIGAANRWAPYLLIGAGGSQVEHDDDDYGDYRETARVYGEIGVGLRWAVTTNFHLAADVRVGSSSEIEDEDGDYDDRLDFAPPGDGDDGADEEEFTRGRLSAMLYF
jgi:hypothetical protein